MIRRHAGVGIVLGLLLGLSPAGCGGGAEDDLPRQAVSGSITLDGKPLDKGMITFDPENMGRGDAVSAGAAIADGSYSIPKAQGPTPGVYRVSIVSGDSGGVATTDEAPGAPPKARAKEPIPAKFNAQSTLKAEVKADGPNTFDYDLTSK